MNGIIEAVRLAGVVGAGGAGFPTHVKLSAQADIVIVNGAECEPLLRVDQQLLVLERDLLLIGLALAMESTGAREGVIALKAKYHAAVNALEGHLPAGVRLHMLPDIYPAGDEVIVVHEVTGRVVPPGGLPIQVGVVVNNVQTLINVAKASHGQPVTRRTLSVTGWVQEPVTLTLPIGTSLQDALQLAGGAKGEKAAYLVGGPVMGSLLTTLDSPITKTTGGLLALPADHSLIIQKQASWSSILVRAKSACLQCAYCTELCPRHLLGHKLSPHLIMRATNYGELAKVEDLTGSLLCSDCGLCEVYACPAGLSPRRINAAYKDKLRAEGIKYAGTRSEEDPLAFARQVPTSGLVQRLNLNDYAHPAPWRETQFVPRKVTIPLRQHIGVAAVPTVERGQQVAEGQIIGEIPSGRLGASVHASIAGRVLEVADDNIVIVGEGSF